jgi:hypothetical protein
MWANEGKRQIALKDADEAEDKRNELVCAFANMKEKEKRVDAMPKRMYIKQFTNKTT